MSGAVKTPGVKPGTTDDSRRQRTRANPGTTHDSGRQNADGKARDYRPPEAATRPCLEDQAEREGVT